MKSTPWGQRWERSKGPQACIFDTKLNILAEISQLSLPGQLVGSQSSHCWVNTQSSCCSCRSSHDTRRQSHSSKYLLNDLLDFQLQGNQALLILLQKPLEMGLLPLGRFRLLLQLSKALLQLLHFRGQGLVGCLCCWEAGLGLFCKARRTKVTCHTAEQLGWDLPRGCGISQTKKKKRRNSLEMWGPMWGGGDQKIKRKRIQNGIFSPSQILFSPSFSNGNIGNLGKHWQ